MEHFIQNYPISSNLYMRKLSIAIRK
uniref:Uncharacterized protein n=1 Tax=Anguilla anguilla TaxID=7936 RepID=A0A0E9QYH9_ANGAN